MKRHASVIPLDALISKHKHEAFVIGVLTPHHHGSGPNARPHKHLPICTCSPLKPNTLYDTTTYPSCHLSHAKRSYFKVTLLRQQHYQRHHMISPKLRLWRHQSPYPTPVVKQPIIGTASMTERTTTPVSYLIRYKLLILTQRCPSSHVAQSTSCRQKRGQPSVSASAADANAVKAATTARTMQKRIVCDNV
jgi:hypothetical protein